MPSAPPELASLSQNIERFFQTARSAFSEHLTHLSHGVESHFRGLRTELERARGEIAVHNRQHADGFNVFSYIRPDENCLSDILADLLNPQGTHGQGETFLRLLLDEIKVLFPTGVRSVKVYREEMTTYIANPLRRIDIVLDFGTFGIGIENKPWAEEQADQVKDYLLHLGRQYGENFLLLYLSGNGTPPPSVGLAELIRREKRNQFRLIDYRVGLVEWLNGCIDLCQAASARWFLENFRTYIMERFEPDVIDWKEPG